MVELKEGDEAPAFELEDADGKVWRLSDLRGDRAIVYFYPEDDTSGCTAQACDFRDRLPVLNEAGYKVLGISPQGAESHRAFIEKYSLNFPLLIDSDLKVAGSYGAAKEMGEDEGAPLTVKRSTFVIDADGRITKAMYGGRAKQHVGLVATLGF